MANVLSERIAELRKERGLTQEQLGQLVGVSAQAVSKWEKGGAPDVELLPALADRLGVTIDALFGREGGEAVDIEKAAGRWLCAFPQEKRFDQLCRLNWSCAKSMVSDVYTMPEIGYLEHAEVTDPDTGETGMLLTQLYLEGGFALDVHADDLSFVTIWPRPEAGYSAYFAENEQYRFLFNTLARPGCLELLQHIYSNPLYFYVSEVLAKSLNLSVPELETFLPDLIKLNIINEMELQLESGPTKAYQGNPRVTLVPFLYMARSMINAGMYMINIGSDSIPLLREGKRTDEKEKKHDTK